MILTRIKKFWCGLVIKVKTINIKFGSSCMNSQDYNTENVNTQQPKIIDIEEEDDIELGDILDNED